MGALRAVCMVACAAIASGCMVGDGTRVVGEAVAESNGVFLNGTTLNGVFLNGVFLNGVFLNGVFLNGVFLNGVFLNGTAEDGTLIEGEAFVGAVLQGVDSNDQPVQLYIDAITKWNEDPYDSADPNDDVMLYRVLAETDWGNWANI